MLFFLVVKNYKYAIISFGDFMIIEKEQVSLIQLDLDNEKSEYELKAIKLTMEGYKDEANYYNIIINMYKLMSKILDKTFDNDLDLFIKNINEEVMNKKIELNKVFNNLEEPTDSFIAGLKLETLNLIYQEVLSKLKNINGN